MKHCCLLLGFLGVSGLVPAGDVPQPAPAAAPAEVQDLVYLDGSRPLLVRLHIHVDGKPFAAAWNAYIDALFAYLDRDGDGVLSREEAERAPGASILLQLLQRDPNRAALVFSQPNNHVAFADLQPTDGRVTRAHLDAYYRRAGLGMFRMVHDHTNEEVGRRLTNALFQALDTDKDGKLSRAELERADESLYKFDINEDDIISVDELAPSPRSPFAERLPPILKPVPPENVGAGFFAVDTRGPSPAIAALLVKHYGKNNQPKLSRSALGLDPAAFARLDANQDGWLDAEELAHWALVVRPDVEVTVRIGKRDGSETPVAVVPSSMTGAIGQTRAGLTWTLGRALIEMHASDEIRPAAFNEREAYLQLFRSADTKKQGFLARKNLKEPKLQQLMNLLPATDDRLTEKDLSAFLQLHAQIPQQVTLTIAEPGRALFDALDANYDGRLSFHELRAAWQRLQVWDRAGVGYITRGDIPRQLQLTFRHGQPLREEGNRVSPFMVRTPAVPPTKGPLWFRKMDRNGDGVVSQREFLGSPAEFQQLDLNGDGVIDLEEAEKADALLRRGASKE